MQEFIGVSICIFVLCLGIGIILKADTPTPYESYNSAISRCEYAKEYQSCIAAVNSAYTRMLKEKVDEK